MMVTAWQQDRKRKQAAQLKSESVAGLEMLIGGVSDLDARQRAEAERKRKAEADAAALALKTSMADAKTATEKSRAEANVLREKRLADDEAARNGERTARADVLRKKASGDAQKQAMEALKARARGGASEVDLRNIAMNDEALGSLDDDAVRSVMLEAQGEERKAAEAQAGAEAKREATERSNRPKPAVLKPKGAKTPEQIEDEALRRRKLKADVEKAEREAKGGGAKPEKPSLTPAEVEPIVELQTGLAIVNQIGKMKTDGKGIDTGPIAAARTWLASKATIADPERVKFKAMVGNQLAEYIKSISGGAVSVEERASLLENVPTTVDDDEEFVAKLDTVRRMLETKLGTKRKAFAATGRPTAIFDDAPPAPAKKPADMTDEEIAARLAQLRGKK